MRGIAAANHNPGRTAFASRRLTQEEVLLLSRWYPRTVTMPEDTAVTVEVKDNTGQWKLPFKVVCRSGVLHHAELGHKISVNVVRWRYG